MPEDFHTASPHDVDIASPTRSPTSPSPGKSRVKSTSSDKSSKLTISITAESSPSAAKKSFSAVQKIDDDIFVDEPVYTNGELGQDARGGATILESQLVESEEGATVCVEDAEIATAVAETAEKAPVPIEAAEEVAVSTEDESTVGKGEREATSPSSICKGKTPVAVELPALVHETEGGSSSSAAEVTAEMVTEDVSAEAEAASIIETACGVEETAETYSAVQTRTIETLLETSGPIKRTNEIDETIETVLEINENVETPEFVSSEHLEMASGIVENVVSYYVPRSECPVEAEEEKSSSENESTKPSVSVPVFSPEKRAKGRFDKISMDTFVSTDPSWVASNPFTATSSNSLTTDTPPVTMPEKIIFRHAIREPVITSSRVVNPSPREIVPALVEVIPSSVEFKIPTIPFIDHDDGDDDEKEEVEDDCEEKEEKFIPPPLEGLVVDSNIPMLQQFTDEEVIENVDNEPNPFKHGFVEDVENNTPFKRTFGKPVLDFSESVDTIPELGCFGIGGSASTRLDCPPGLEEINFDKEEAFDRWLTKHEINQELETIGDSTTSNCGTRDIIKDDGSLGDTTSERSHGDNSIVNGRPISLGDSGRVSDFYSGFEEDFYSEPTSRYYGIDLDDDQVLMDETDISTNLISNDNNTLYNNTEREQRRTIEQEFIIWLDKVNKTRIPPVISQAVKEISKGGKIIPYAENDEQNGSVVPPKKKIPEGFEHFLTQKNVDQGMWDRLIQCVCANNPANYTFDPVWSVKNQATMDAMEKAGHALRVMVHTGENYMYLLREMTWEGKEKRRLDLESPADITEIGADQLVVAKSHFVATEFLNYTDRNRVQLTKVVEYLMNALYLDNVISYAHVTGLLSNCLLQAKQQVRQKFLENDSFFIKVLGKNLEKPGVPDLLIALLLGGSATFTPGPVKTVTGDIDIYFANQVFVQYLKKLLQSYIDYPVIGYAPSTSSNTSGSRTGTDEEGKDECIIEEGLPEKRELDFTPKGRLSSNPNFTLSPEKIDGKISESGDKIGESIKDESITGESTASGSSSSSSTVQAREDSLEDQVGAVVSKVIAVAVKGVTQMDDGPSKSGENDENGTLSPVRDDNDLGGLYETCDSFNANASIESLNLTENLNQTQQEDPLQAKIAKETWNFRGTPLVELLRFLTRILEFVEKMPRTQAQLDFVGILFDSIPLTAFLGEVSSHDNAEYSWDAMKCIDLVLVLDFSKAPDFKEALVKRWVHKLPDRNFQCVNMRYPASPQNSKKKTLRLGSYITGLLKTVAIVMSGLARIDETRRNEAEIANFDSIEWDNSKARSNSTEEAEHGSDGGNGSDDRKSDGEDGICEGLSEGIANTMFSSVISGSGTSSSSSEPFPRVEPSSSPTSSEEGAAGDTEDEEIYADHSDKKNTLINATNFRKNESIDGSDSTINDLGPGSDSPKNTEDETKEGETSRFQKDKSSEKKTDFCSLNIDDYYLNGMSNCNSSLNSINSETNSEIRLRNEKKNEHFHQCQIILGRIPDYIWERWIEWYRLTSKKNQCAHLYLTKMFTLLCVEGSENLQWKVLPMVLESAFSEFLTFNDGIYSERRVQSAENSLRGWYRELARKIQTDAPLQINVDMTIDRPLTMENLNLNLRPVLGCGVVDIGRQNNAGRDNGGNGSTSGIDNLSGNSGGAAFEGTKLDGENGNVANLVEQPKNDDKQQQNEQRNPHQNALMKWLSGGTLGGGNSSSSTNWNTTHDSRCWNSENDSSGSKSSTEWDSCEEGDSSSEFENNDNSQGIEFGKFDMRNMMQQQPFDGIPQWTATDLTTTDLSDIGDLCDDAGSRKMVENFVENWLEEYDGMNNKKTNSNAIDEEDDDLALSPDDDDSPTANPTKVVAGKPPRLPEFLKNFTQKNTIKDTKVHGKENANGKENASPSSGLPVIPSFVSDSISCEIWHEVEEEMQNGLSSSNSPSSNSSSTEFHSPEDTAAPNMEEASKSVVEIDIAAENVNDNPLEKEDESSDPVEKTNPTGAEREGDLEKDQKESEDLKGSDDEHLFGSDSDDDNGLLNFLTETRPDVVYGGGNMVLQTEENYPVLASETGLELTNFGNHIKDNHVTDSESNCSGGSGSPQQFGSAEDLSVLQRNGPVAFPEKLTELYCDSPIGSPEKDELVGDFLNEDFLDEENEEGQGNMLSSIDLSKAGSFKGLSSLLKTSTSEDGDDEDIAEFEYEENMKCAFNNLTIGGNLKQNSAEGKEKSDARGGDNAETGAEDNAETGAGDGVESGPADTDFVFRSVEGEDANTPPESPLSIEEAAVQILKENKPDTAEFGLTATDFAAPSSSSTGLESGLEASLESGCFATSTSVAPLYDDILIEDLSTGTEELAIGFEGIIASEPQDEQEDRTVLSQTKEDSTDSLLSCSSEDFFSQDFSQHKFDVTDTHDLAVPHDLAVAQSEDKASPLRASPPRGSPSTGRQASPLRKSCSSPVFNSDAQKPAIRLGTGAYLELLQVVMRVRNEVKKKPTETLSNINIISSNFQNLQNPGNHGLVTNHNLNSSGVNVGLTNKTSSETTATIVDQFETQISEFEEMMKRKALLLEHWSWPARFKKTSQNTLLNNYHLTQLFHPILNRVEEPKEEKHAEKFCEARNTPPAPQAPQGYGTLGFNPNRGPFNGSNVM